MLKLFIPVLSLTLSSLLFAATSYAQGKDDFNQPIEVKSERDWFDVANKIAVFESNVVIRQGSLTITADHLEVKREGENENDLFIATGLPAVYSQQLDDGSPIQAEANVIEYDQANQLLVLRGNVKVSQRDSLIQGSEIIYNFATQQMSANRGDQEDDRVTTIFMPKPKKNDNNEPTNR